MEEHSVIVVGQHTCTMDVHKHRGSGKGGGIKDKMVKPDGAITEVWVK